MLGSSFVSDPPNEIRGSWKPLLLFNPWHIPAATAHKCHLRRPRAREPAGPPELGEEGAGGGARRRMMWHLESGGLGVESQF